MTPAIIRKDVVALAIQLDNHRDYTEDFDLYVYVRDGKTYGVVSGPEDYVEVVREEVLTPDEGGSVAHETVKVTRKNSPKRARSN